MLARAIRGAALAVFALTPSVAVAGPAAPAPGQSTDAPPAMAPGQARDAPPPPTRVEPTPTHVPTPEPEPAPATLPTLATASPVKATPRAAVDDATWSALKGRQVVVETANGPMQGELLESTGDSLVLVGEDGRVASLRKSQATGVRVATPPASTASPKDEMAALGPADRTEPEPEAQAQDGGPTEDEGKELTKGEQRRKDRREKREHALLGAFTMQGATYSYWRGDGVNGGGASYAMDFGVGGNFSPKFGMYAMAGGLLGAKIDNKSIKANYGHLAGLFVFGGKYYYSTVGAGVAFSRLRFADGRLHRDVGLAMPFKLMGKIPLPKKLYIGLGLTYEFAAVRGFSRFVNAIGGQLVFGRW